MKKILNKWQLHFCLKKSFERDLGWHEFSFGILNLYTFPKEAEKITKRNYKGFLIRFYFWLPITF